MYLLSSVCKILKPGSQSDLQMILFLCVTFLIGQSNWSSFFFFFAIIDVQDSYLGSQSDHQMFFLFIITDVQDSYLGSQSDHQMYLLSTTNV